MKYKSLKPKLILSMKTVTKRGENVPTKTEKSIKAETVVNGENDATPSC